MKTFLESSNLMINNAEHFQLVVDDLATLASAEVSFEGTQISSISVNPKGGTIN